MAAPLTVCNRLLPILSQARVRQRQKERLRPKVASRRYVVQEFWVSRCQRLSARCVRDMRSRCLNLDIVECRHISTDLPSLLHLSADPVQPVTLHVYSNSQTRGENTRRSGRHVLAAHAFTGRVFFSISLNRTCQRQDLSQDKLVGEWRSALAKLREQVLPPLTDTTRLQIPATSQKRCVSHCRRTWAYAWP